MTVFLLLVLVGLAILCGLRIAYGLGLYHAYKDINDILNSYQGALTTAVKKLRGEE